MSSLLRVAVGAAALVAAAVVVAPAAAAGPCVGSVSDLLKQADVAFVGTIASIRQLPGKGVPQFAYRFKVDKAAKGQVGDFATVRAARLVDCNLRPLTADTRDAVGVLASRENGRLVTSEKGLVDPGSLLGAADAPKGGGIKVAIGLVLAAIVIAYSYRRLKRRELDDKGSGPAGPRSGSNGSSPRSTP